MDERSVCCAPRLAELVESEADRGFSRFKIPRREFITSSSNVSGLCRDPNGADYCKGVPNHYHWGHDIGWGHAWSKNLMRWEYDERPILMPAEEYDSMGVFTVSKRQGRCPGG
jgi:hypothetical protein